MPKSSIKLSQVAALSLLILALSACGGGGSTAPVTFTSTPTTPVIETPSANLPAVEISAIEIKDPGSSLAEGWHKGAFMEIYVRGYKDSDGDGIGDLRGVTQSLDYLKELGIKGIWLMPISRSEDGDHGYATTDYRNIETAFGNLADFDELIKQAHARGIGVILDYVMNHSGAKHPLFINSADTTTNAYRAWYVWKDTMPSGWNIFGGNPWYSTKNGAYFAAFYSGMPDFNLLNPSVLAFHQNNLRFWLNRGADGFRFDAVGNLVENNAGAWESQPESIAIMGKIRLTIEAYNKRYIVCEAPGNPLAFAAKESCGNAFAFNHNHDIVNAAKGQSGAVRAVADYFNTASVEMATMLSNHDEFVGARLWDRVGGDQAQYRLAAATYLLQPGTPFIYYGEEIGLAGAANLSGDHKLRTPMSWSSNAANAGFTTGTPFRALSGNVATQNLAAQLNDPNSLYRFYRTMLALRNSRPSLNAGNYSNVAVSGSVLSFQRQSGDEKTVVAINYGASESTVVLLNLAAKANLNSLFPDTTLALTADANGNAQLKLAAQTVMVLKVQ